MKTLVHQHTNQDGHTRFAVSFIDGTAGTSNHHMTFIAALTPGELAALERQIRLALDVYPVA